MAISRLELLLRESSVHEQDLASRLVLEAGTYGGKNTFMRECLARGYAILESKLEGNSSESWDFAMASNYLGFRVLKTHVEKASDLRKDEIKGTALSEVLSVEVLNHSQLKESDVVNTLGELDKTDSLEVNEDVPKPKVNWGKNFGTLVMQGQPSKKITPDTSGDDNG